MFDVPNVLGSMPDVVSENLIVIDVVDVFPVAALIGGAPVMTVAEGAAVSTRKLEKLAWPAIGFPAWSFTLAARLTVYVPWKLAPQVAAGAVMVYVTLSPLTENPVTVVP